MADENPDFDRIDHEIRINELKERARELTGGQMREFESDEGPDDPEHRQIREAFWENVVKIEESGWISSRQQLQAAGLVLPKPEELTDEQLAAKLHELIEHLAKLRTFLYSTNHLSDRELYTELLCEVLDDSVPEAIANSPTGAHIIDLLGSGSEADTYLHMKYYADEQDRAWWLKDFPDYEMPSHEDPPFDRDRLLPRPEEEQMPEQRKPRPQDKPIDLKEIVDGMYALNDETRTYYDGDTGTVVFIQEEFARFGDDENEEEDNEEKDEESLPDWQHEERATARAVAEDESDRFVALPDRFEVNEWEMMRKFAEDVPDAALSERLLRAIHGKGAFRYFKDVLYQAGVEKEWFAFRDESYRQIAREWAQRHNVPLKPEAEG